MQKLPIYARKSIYKDLQLSLGVMVEKIIANTNDIYTHIHSNGTSKVQNEPFWAVG